MVILMISTGIFLIFLTKVVIFTKFNVVMCYTTKTLFKKVDKSMMEKGAITPLTELQLLPTLLHQPTILPVRGCVASLDAVWEFADLFNGLMAVPDYIRLTASYIVSFNYYWFILYSAAFTISSSSFAFV